MPCKSWIFPLVLAGSILNCWCPNFNSAYGSENRGYGYAGGGDHDVPTPFHASEIRFELADGEIYILTGRVVFIPSALERTQKLMPHLAVDLSQYPWLANSKRLNTPFYPLEGSPQEWKEWSNFPVKVMCKAHGRVTFFRGKPEYVITLEPVERR